MKRIIDLEKITAVLLLDGEWHDVRKGTFKAEGYINAEEGECDVTKCLATKAGVTWVDAETGDGFACPVSSIGAIKYIRRKDDVVEC